LLDDISIIAYKNIVPFGI